MESALKADSQQSERLTFVIGGKKVRYGQSEFVFRLQNRTERQRVIVTQPGVGVFVRHSGVESQAWDGLEGFKAHSRHRELGLDRGFTRFGLALITRRIHGDDLVLVVALSDAVNPGNSVAMPSEFRSFPD